MINLWRVLLGLPNITPNKRRPRLPHGAGRRVWRVQVSNIGKPKVATPRVVVVVRRSPVPIGGNAPLCHDCRPFAIVYAVAPGVMTNDGVPTICRCWRQVPPGPVEESVREEGRLRAARIAR